MLDIELSDATFEMFAIKQYDNPHCTGIAEFNEDMNRFKYLRRLLNKYEECGEMRENLILNHVVVIFNLFPVAGARMIFYKVEEKHWPVITPFLIYLSRMPSEVRLNADRVIRDSDIQIDMNVVKILREFNRQGC